MDSAACEHQSKTLSAQQLRGGFNIVDSVKNYSSLTSKHKHNLVLSHYCTKPQFSIEADMEPILNPVLRIPRRMSSQHPFSSCLQTYQWRPAAHLCLPPLSWCSNTRQGRKQRVLQPPLCSWSWVPGCRIPPSLVCTGCCRNLIWRGMEGQKWVLVCSLPPPPLGPCRLRRQELHRPRRPNHVPGAVSHSALDAAWCAAGRCVQRRVESSRVLAQVKR